MQDSYLDEYQNQDHIDNATAHIEAVYPDIVDVYHKARLIDIQAYLNVCRDNQHDADDLFVQKYKLYKNLFKEAVTDAKSKINEAAGLSSLTIPLERA